jgi:DNA-binding transcriptional MerR regulator
LNRLQQIHKLRDAGLPLKMIIEAARRGEDLGPSGALWLVAGRAREGRHTTTAGPSFVADPKAYALMQALTNRGVAPATVLLLALRAAHASSALASELKHLLAIEVDELALEADRLPTPARADVIDLATVITREMLGHGLAAS